MCSGNHTEWLFSSETYTLYYELILGEKILKFIFSPSNPIYLTGSIAKLDKFKLDNLIKQFCSLDIVLADLERAHHFVNFEYRLPEYEQGTDLLTAILNDTKSIQNIVAANNKLNRDIRSIIANGA